MRRGLIWFLAAICAFLVASIAVFASAMQLSWVDATYFTITTATSTGYGDISLLQSPGWLKLYGNVVMLAGTAAMAAGFGVMTDFLVGSRLDALFGRRRKKVQDHVILCGLGNVGVRVLERLLEIGEHVVVVEHDENSRFVARARELGVDIVVGDMRNTVVLEQACCAKARSIIACSNDDLANLEASLAARAVNGSIRVVLRMFNQGLARRLESSLGITTALSTSTLAAPAFALAALEASVVGSFQLGDELMLTITLPVEAGAPLEGRSIGSLRELGDGRITALRHEPAAGKAVLNPAVDRRLAAGDRLVVVAPVTARRDLERLLTREG